MWLVLSITEWNDLTELWEDCSGEFGCDEVEGTLDIETMGYFGRMTVLWWILCDFGLHFRVVQSRIEACLPQDNTI